MVEFQVQLRTGKLQYVSCLSADCLIEWRLQAIFIHIIVLLVELSALRSNIMRGSSWFFSVSPRNFQVNSQN